MHDITRIDPRQTPDAVACLVNPTASKQLPPTQRTRRVSPELGKLSDNSSSDSFKQNFTPSTQQLADPAAFYMQPEKGGMQHHATPHGFPYQSHQFHSAQNRSGPHNMPYREFSGTHQGMTTHQFPSGIHPHAIPSTMSYNTHVNGPEEIIHPTQQLRQEHSYGSSVSSAHNEYPSNNRPHSNSNNTNRVGHRRGSQSQRPHGFAPSQQPQVEHNAAFQESHFNKSWRRGPQQDRARQSSWCRNPMGSSMEYCPCTCEQCTERNRSVWVRLSPEAFVSMPEVLSFLKCGLSTRFGKVEEAFQAASMKRDAFIVRFESESSVPQALAFGMVMVPEKNVRITIQPVHRSKWMKPRHPQHQPRKLPPLPITHQQPSRDESFSPSENHAHVQMPPSCSLAPSLTSTSEPDQQGIPSRPTSTSTLPQTCSSSQRMGKQAISPIVESKWDEKPVKLPAPIEVPVANREHFAFEEPREHAANPTSFPSQAMDYSKVGNSDKESVPYSESLSEEPVAEKSISSVTATSDLDSSKCSSPKMVDIALPNTPINSICSSSDTPKATFYDDRSPTTGTSSPMSKNNYRKVKSPSPVVVEDRQQQTSSVIGEVKNAAPVHKEGGNETTTSSDLKRAQNHVKDIERPPITAVASPEKHIESSTNGSAQTSGYTEEEIKERKQAWNRIPMPLDPRKSKKIGTTVVSSQQPSLSFPSEPSNSITEKADIATPHIMKRDQLKSINSPGLDKVNPEQSAKAEGLAKDDIQYRTTDETLDSEPKSAQLCTVPPESRLSTNMATKEETQSSKTKVSSPRQTELEETHATASNSQAPASENKASDTANSQTKSKSKWNKAKKSKKRPILTPLTVLQNEGSSQDISPSVSETPFIPKEELQADYSMLPSAPATSESPSDPVYLAEKPDERATMLFKGPVDQAMTNVRSQYSYDTLPRGRHEFRSNAGGSLKVPKKRKTKYPAITSKTFEASSNSRFEPPQPKYAVSGQMPLRSTDVSNGPDSVKHVTEPDSSKKSRLNPLALAFESPQKVSVAAGDTVKAPNHYKAGSFRMRGQEVLPRENQSPSKFKIMQRAMAAHNSPTKSQQPKERLVRRIDSSKASDGFEISSKQQENNPAEIQRSWSNDRHRNEGESKEPVNSKAISPNKKGTLDKEDWPSLPASRVRSATLQ